MQNMEEYEAFGHISDMYTTDIAALPPRLKRSKFYHAVR